MERNNKIAKEIWVASGLRTPFAKESQALQDISAIDLSVAVLDQMKASQRLDPDYVAWGTVVPDLSYRNIARDAVLDSTLSDNTRAFSTTLACSTSLLAVIQLAGMLSSKEIGIAGGVESFSNLQLGLSTKTSKWLRTFNKAKGLLTRIKLIPGLFGFKLYVPSGTNRKTGKSMGEHAEITAQRLGVSRLEQDELAQASHENYFKAKEKGFFDDLYFSAFGLAEDSIPRANSNLEKLATLKPVFDRSSGNGSLTAGNSTLFTDGAAGVWVAGKERISEINTPYKAKIVDWEIAAVDIDKEGMLMSPSFALPQMLERNGMTYDDVDVWEIHEAFASQVLSTIKNLEDPAHLAKAGVEKDMGIFPYEKLNINGGSIAIGHPFGATGARILSQAIKVLHETQGRTAVLSVCADGGLGAVMLIER